MKTAFKRMKMPLSYFKKDPMDKVIGCAKRCLDTPDGDVLLKHLITEYRIDESNGCLPSDELTYRSNQRDVIIYILSLINDK